MLSHRAVALVVAFTLIGPSAAAAQSGASDNQYADPFANTPAGGRGAPAHTTTPRRGPSATAPAPSQPAAPVAAAAPAGSAASASGPPNFSGTPSVGSGTGAIAGSASTGASPRTLPFTGFNALDEAIAGAVLLLAGTWLRLRLRRREASGVSSRAPAS